MACSSLYQRLIVATASVTQPCAGSKARSTSLSLNTTLVLGWLASLKGYPRAQVGQAGVLVGAGGDVGVRVAVGTGVAVRVGVTVRVGVNVLVGFPEAVGVFVGVFVGIGVFVAV